MTRSHHHSPLRRLARLRSWVFCLVGVVVGGCAPKPSGSTGSSTAAPSCAPCVCACEATPSVARGPDVRSDTGDAELARRLAELERKEKVGELLASAQAKMNRSDAKGCLTDLDAAAKLDARHETSMMLLRAQCTMRAGDCERGKRLAREWYTSSMMQHQLGPEQIESAVEGLARTSCQGKMSDRDALLKALMELQQGAYMTKKDASFCTSRYETIMKLRGRVKPKNAEDREIVTLRDRPEVVGHTLSACYGRAGDCRRGRQAYDRVMAPHYTAIADPAQKEGLLQQGFESLVPLCKRI